MGEGLARRFVRVELDARREDPEARRFRGDLSAEAGERRAELLAACLTVWRWRRQRDAAGALALPMGSRQFARSVDGSDTNGAESFFPRMRRGEVGHNTTSPAPTSRATPKRARGGRTTAGTATARRCGM